MGHRAERRAIEERGGKRYFVVYRDYGSAGYRLSLFRASDQPEEGLRLNIYEASPGGHAAASVMSTLEALYLLSDDSIVHADQVEVVEVKPEVTF